MTAEPARLISFDEAGFTGPRLLDSDQPVFAYASHDLTHAEAASIVSEIRTKYRIQAAELKSQLLRRRANWPVIAMEVANAVEGRANVIAFDKKLNLGGKAYEYLFEPVLQDNSALFYRHDMHKFIMNAMHRSMFSTDQPIDILAHELEAFMRSFNPLDAPSLFREASKQRDLSTILNYVERFSRGYAQIISSKTQHLRTEQSQLGKWTLDLTSSALFSLLFRGWGHKYARLEVLCDASKPLEAVADFFNAWVDREGSVKISDGKQLVDIRGNLSKPISFGASIDHPTIQIADILAGITADSIRNENSITNKELISWTSRHSHYDCVLPSDEHIDTRKLIPRVNLHILSELARRADLGAAPLDGMEDLYHAALKRFKSPAARIRNPISRRKRFN